MFKILISECVIRGKFCCQCSSISVSVGLWKLNSLHLLDTPYTALILRPCSLQVMSVSLEQLKSTHSRVKSPIIMATPVSGSEDLLIMNDCKARQWSCSLWMFFSHWAQVLQSWTMIKRAPDSSLASAHHSSNVSNFSTSLSAKKKTWLMAILCYTFCHG